MDDGAGQFDRSVDGPNHEQALDRSVLRQGLGSFALQIGSAAATTGSAILFARFLGAEQYGVYAFVVAVAGLLVLPGTLGLPDLAVREIAAYWARNEWAELCGFVRWTIVWVLAASVGIAVVVAGMAALLGLASEEIRTALLITLPVVPLVALARLAGGILRGFRHVILGNLSEALVRPIASIVAVLIIYSAIGERLDAKWAAGVHVVGGLATLVVAGALARSKIPAQIFTMPGQVHAARWIRAAIPMLFIGTMHVITLNTDVVMLGMLQETADAGVYRVAAGSAQAVTFVLGAANAVLQPVVSGLFARGDLARLQREVTRGVRFVVSVSVPVALVLIIFGRQILGLVFGNDFEAGSTALAVLVGGQMVNAAVGSAGVVLTMTGSERHTATALAFGAGINVAANAILIPLFGLEGAAVATASSVVVWNLILARRSIQVVGVDPTILGGLRRTRRP